jgi:GT2 family glycosyltransferase
MNAFALSTLKQYVQSERAGHVTNLAAAARQLLASHPVLAWLAADRLVRITSQQEATPYFLRSAAAAARGSRTQSARDLAVAFHRNPHQQLIAESALLSRDPALRVAAARAVLAMEDLPERHGAALQILSDEGVSHAVSLRLDGGMVHGRAHYLSARMLQIIWQDGQRSGRLALPDSGPIGTVRRFAFPWPHPAEAIRFSADPDTTVLLPEVLRRIATLPPATDANPPAGRSGLLLIVPVYGDAVSTRRCLEGLLAAVDVLGNARIVVIDDESPDPEMANLLGELATDARISLLRNPVNLGFAGSVNRALVTRAKGEDVCLVNADAFPSGKALDVMWQVLRGDPSIATVTPLSNNGEDSSIPVRLRINPLPAPDAALRLELLAQAVHGTTSVELPNGVGFCLMIAGAVLDRIGGFSGDFDRGYFEDVDFCLRARLHGYRNVCALGAYVPHAGSRSFQAEKAILVRRNLALLNEKHPGFAEEALRMVQDDPLEAATQALCRADLARQPALRVLCVPADSDDRLVSLLHGALPQSTATTVLMRLSSHRSGWDCVVTTPGGGFPGTVNIRIDGKDDPERTLREAMPGLAGGELLFVDPARLAKPIGAALSMIATLRAAVILASDAVGPDVIPRWCRLTARPMVTTPAMRDHVIQAGLGDVALLQLLPKTVPRTRSKPPAPGTLALIVNPQEPEHLGDIEQLASTLAASGVALCVMGAVAGDLDLMVRHTNLWFTGRIDPREIAGWLERAGINALAWQSRRYALSDPLLTEIGAAGLHVASFAPLERVSSHQLFVSHDRSVAEFGARIAAWMAPVQGDGAVAIST